MRLLLVRHGQSTWNAVGRWQGSADPPLSPLGEAQAADAINHLRDAGLRGAVCSPLRRARHTAEIISRGLGIGPPVIVDGLAERDVGAWSGLTTPEIHERFPAAREAVERGGRLEPPGEGRLEFLRRIVPALQSIESLGIDDPVLVVCHGGVINVLTAALGAPATRTENLGGRWFELQQGVLFPGDVLGTAVPEATSASPTL